MVSASRIVTPFGAGSTAAEVVAGIDLTGRRAIVTGGASGIGVETARALAGAGAEVTLAVRNIEAGDRTAEDIIATTGNKQVLVAPLDLADRASVAGFVAGWDGPLHILVNNAGVMATPETRTTEGWELQFATNHLGHFALATGLHRGARRGRRRPRRVGQLERAPALAGRLRRHPLRSGAYDPWLAYGQSKTANVLFAVEARQRWADDGITVNALMPGGIRTNLQRHVTRGGAADAPPERRQCGVRWKTPSRAPPRRCWSRRHRCSTASAAATSRTATRPSRTSPVPVGRRGVRARPGGGRAALGGVGHRARALTPTRTADGEGYIRCAGSVREVSGRELVVLGTASQAPTRHRNHNGYLLRWDGEGLLFDPGEGTQRQMLLAGCRGRAITRICLTHFHGDHCLGLPGVVQRLSLDRVAHPVRAHFPASRAGVLRAAAPRDASFHDVVDLREEPVDRDGAVAATAAGRWRRAGWTTRSRRSATAWSSPTGAGCCRTGSPRHGIAGPDVGRLQRAGRLDVDGRTVRLDEVSDPGRDSGSRS